MKRTHPRASCPYTLPARAVLLTLCKSLARAQVNDYELKKWADGAGVAYKSFEELCKNPAAAEMVTKDLNAIGKVG